MPIHVPYRMTVVSTIHAFQDRLFIVINYSAKMTLHKNIYVYYVFRFEVEKKCTIKFYAKLQHSPSFFYWIRSKPSVIWSFVFELH